MLNRLHSGWSVKTTLLLLLYYYLLYYNYFKQTSLWLVCEDSESEPVAAARAAHLLRAADDRGRHPGASPDLLLQIYFSFNIFLPARREDGEGGENTA